MVGGVSLLHSDDDSDVPDLDLPMSNRRRTFFNKSPTSEYTELRQRRKSVKKIMVLSFALIFLFLVYFLYSALSRIKKIDDELRVLRSEASHMHELDLEVRKLRMQLDFYRENDENNHNNTMNSTKPVTALIYDQIGSMSSKFQNVQSGFQRISLSMEDVTSRMSRVENQCLAVCHHDRFSKEPQQRRRQTKEKKPTDDIVFKRTN
ncbi:unnamed protein product [Caenorhabditis bovis]|uniref:Uncharacterized protein n=1 Tax=Caenorhabditis bovis TaxID=2654633 RepID=A0A8S1ERN5_9PELO|nr:unnamed protein product [Caenorhabditis bovis]